MRRPDRFSRRQAIALSGAAALAALAQADSRRARTPAQTSGPFYPLDKPLDTDADLTVIQGRAGRAAGQVIHVTGRVLDVAGAPVPGARLEIWQANTHGRYRHPDDGNSAAPLDPHFEGYAALRTDSQGWYRFKTIKPAPYPAGNRMRPAHIHFDVRGRVDRLVTQMYFPGDELMKDDFVLAPVRGREHLLIADMGPPTGDLEPDSRLARWDIVLEWG
jgi:protocatechuate 3,4-dioxygenase beta subunit